MMTRSVGCSLFTRGMSRDLRRGRSEGSPPASPGDSGQIGTPMIDSLLDACEYIFNDQGEPQSSYWLASQIMEMKLWRASEADVEAALAKDIDQQGDCSRFMRVSEDEFALRAWTEEKRLAAFSPLPPQLNTAYPAVSKWVHSYGWIEVGQQEMFGFVVRALDDGGMVFDSEECQTFDDAMNTLETGLREWFDEQGESVV